MWLLCEHIYRCLSFCAVESTDWSDWNWKWSDDAESAEWVETLEFKYWYFIQGLWWETKCLTIIINKCIAVKYTAI